MRDLTSHLDFRSAIAPVAAAGAGNAALVSSILNRIGVEGVVLVLLTGNLEDADATFAVTMEHGDDPALADAVPVPADQMNGSLANAGFNFTSDNKCRKVGYVGGKQYVRATVTPSGNTGNAPISALWVLGHTNFGPTPSVPA